MLKRHFTFLALAIAALALVACDDAPESGRGTVTVSSINSGLPITSTVATPGDVAIPMEFRWRPYNTLNTITEAAPHGDILIEHYTITWTRVSGGTGALPTRSEDTQIFLPVYEPGVGFVRLVTSTEKGDASLAALPVTMTAHFDFVAREMGSTHEMEFSTQATVIFN